MKVKILLLLLLLTTVDCFSQDLKQFYSKEFNWRIDIPDGFTTVSAQKAEETDAKGKLALEKTLGQPIENKAIDIFRFQRDKQNYFQANYQPYDERKDGKYRKNLGMLHKVVYQTFATQFPTVKIDSVTTTETISGIKFVAYKMSINIPNKGTMEMYMYSHLFGKKDFTVTIICRDEKVGQDILAAWRGSKFSRM